MKNDSVSWSFLFFLTSLFVLISFFAACTKSKSESTIRHEIDAYLKSVDFNGSALVAQGGEILVSRGYGMANFELDVTNTPQTKFRIGSMTKQFTAMAIMQLQEQGKLGVDDHISKYMDIPETWKDITLHHLLTHTSGIPIYYNYPEYYAYSRYPIKPRELVETVMDKPLLFEPGEECRYSCTNFNVLGYIVELISGMSYADFLNEHIFKPLEMRDSGFDDPSSVLKNRASGYYWMANGELANAGFIHMTVPYAAGALYSTVEDLFKWDRVLYTDKLVTKQTLETMFTPFTFSAKYGFHNGYGVWISNRNDRTMVGHSGGVNGFSTYIARYLNDDVFVTVLSNIMGAWPGVGKISHDLAAIVFSEDYEAPKKKHIPEIVAIDPADYDAYVGQYAYEYVISIKKRNDGLYFQGSWRPDIEIFPVSETDFVLDGIKVTFVKNAKGDVTHLIYRSGGEETNCPKIK